MNLSSQLTYWDRVAAEKRFSHPVRVDWLEQHHGPSKTEAILDYGCGYGRTLNELIQAGYRNVIGIDFSSGMLTRCRLENPDIPLVQNDGHTLPLKSGCIDIALLFAVLTCIPDGEEQKSQLAEVRRVLRPGGFLYLSDLLLNDDRRNRERYDRYANVYQCYGVFELPEGVVVRHHAKDWIDRLTEPFEPLEYEPFEVTTMNLNKSLAFQYLGRKASGS